MPDCCGYGSLTVYCAMHQTPRTAGAAAKKTKAKLLFFCGVFVARFEKAPSASAAPAPSPAPALAPSCFWSWQMGVFGQLKTTLQYASWGVFALSLLLASLSLKTLLGGLSLFYQGAWAEAYAAVSKFGAENVFVLRLGALSLLLSWVAVPILFCLDAVCSCCSCAGRAAAVVAVASPAKAAKAAAPAAAPAKEAAAPAAEAAPAKPPAAKAARSRASSTAAKRQ